METVVQSARSGGKKLPGGLLLFLAIRAIGSANETCCVGEVNHVRQGFRVGGFSEPTHEFRRFFAWNAQCSG